MYIKIQKVDEAGRVNDDYYLFECSTYRLEHLGRVESFDGNIRFVIGVPPSALEQNPCEAVMLRMWGRDDAFQEALIFAPAGGYVTNEQGATIERFRV